MPIVLLLACLGSSLHEPGTSPAPSEPEPEETGLYTPEIEWSVALDAPTAFDPTRGAAVEFDVSAAGVGPLVVTLTDADGAEVERWERDIDSTSWGGAFQWSGPSEAEIEQLGAAEYWLRAEVLDGEGAVQAEDETAVVAIRLGIESALAEGDGGVSARRIPLYWHRARQLQDVAVPFAVSADGAFPATSDDLNAPPDPAGAYNEPVAWAWDSLPILTLVPRASLPGADLAIDVPGWTVISQGDAGAGDPVVLQRDDPLAAGPGVFEAELEIAFSLDGERVTSQILPVRFYALLDGPGFTEGQQGEHYNPWVAAVDPALRGIDGVAPDRDAVLDALVEWIFYEQDLSYDTAYGASAYTDYQGDWTRAHFYFTEFLERRFGSVVNCSDCASILTAYANMIGAPQSYLIILRDFDLNEILAIGGDGFSSCPFPPQGCGFSYHAVTTGDGERIWDATLALDGDGDPGNAPSTELLVQDIPGEDYLDMLVRSGRAGYDHMAQGTLQ